MKYKAFTEVIKKHLVLKTNILAEINQFQLRNQMERENTSEFSNQFEKAIHYLSFGNLL